MKLEQLFRSKVLGGNREGSGGNSGGSVGGFNPNLKHVTWNTVVNAGGMDGVGRFSVNFSAVDENGVADLVSVDGLSGEADVIPCNMLYYFICPTGEIWVTDITVTDKNGDESFTCAGVERLGEFINIYVYDDCNITFTVGSGW